MATNELNKTPDCILTKAEIDALKEYADDNLAIGTVEIYQEGPCTKVQITNLPETLIDITDSLYL